MDIDPMTTDTRTTIETEDVERVAEAAAKIGYKGIDATPAIALGEYGFMTRRGTPYVSLQRESWDVLVHVPNDGYPGGPGFKFVGLSVDDYPTRHDITDELHEIRHPLSYLDEPHGPDETIELLRCYHKPGAEPKPGEARRVLKDKTEQLASREPVPPHMTDQYYLAEFASLHEDPLSVLRAATKSRSERREKSGKRLLDDVMSNWQSVPMSKFRDTETDHPVARFVYTEENTSNHH